MSHEELVKKKKKSKRSSKNTTQKKRNNTFPTLGHIVLSGGLVVEIPKLPTDISQLTTYDHLRIALEHGALAMSSLNQLTNHSIPRLADTHNMDPIRLNLEDLLNHLYYAIQDFPKDTEST